jgi:hypothetical protein
MATSDRWDPFEQGRQAGIQRAIENDLFDDGEPDHGALIAAEEALASLRQTLPRDAPERYVALCAEVTTVAVLSRARYHERPLRARELRLYERFFRVFLNSFAHRHGRR